MKVQKALSLDDVLLVPKYSEVSSRSLVDTSVDLGKGFKLRIPIISSNMKHVTEVDMAKAMAEMGGLAILHRFCTIEEQVSMWLQATDNSSHENEKFVGAAVGVKEEDKQRVEQLYKFGCSIVCVDVAHGYSKACLDMTKWIAQNYPDVLLISGNAAEGRGALAIAEAGADIVKVNVGSGSICSTRIETGNGVPAITALESAYKASLNDDGTRKFKIIQDGGCKNAGDVAKSLCFADAVMCGQLLAGTSEAPGSIIEIDGHKYKEYNGSSTHKANRVEGVFGFVAFKGSVKPILQSIVEGVQSACSYQGCHNLEELKEDPEFIEITSAGMAESKPHLKIQK